MVTETFSLHAKLAADTISIGDLQSSRLLLMNDARYAWLILVPRCDQVMDLDQLTDDDRTAVWKDIMQVSAALRALTNPFKLNIAALGNQVPQLHIHIVARNQGDAAWPGPVWGVGDAEPYDPNIATTFVDDCRQALGL